MLALGMRFRVVGLVVLGSEGRWRLADGHVIRRLLAIDSPVVCTIVLAHGKPLHRVRLLLLLLVRHFAMRFISAVAM